MKISFNWLKEYILTDLSPERIGQILTDTGLEVEGIEKIEAVKGGLEGVVIGEVLTCEKHPDADKLKVTTVNVGQVENLQIVCGAPNVAAGQKVIVATVGCTLYPNPEEPFKIKTSKIRGVDSQGMLCAEDELGLGQSHDGILVLPADTKVGMTAAKYFELEDDFVLEIGLTPNRSDAMGHVGVARDIAAYLTLHQQPTKVIWPTVEELKGTGEGNVSITIEDPAACARYTGTTILNVKVQASPAWLQNRLRAIGLSPINNVVDCTNYVMHELGTPLHAFDMDVLNGQIVVKRGLVDQEITTLDEVKRKISPEDQLITNGKDNLCLAGVFGGLNSGIKDSTTNVFLESAYFEPVVTRKMARNHGLNTDASFRFERGVDPQLTFIALKRLANLILQVAGGKVGMEPVDVHPTKVEGATISFSPDRCRKLIGTAIPNESMKTILTSLDIQIQKEENEIWTLLAPAYRVEVTREADVVEEILRIYGFNNVPLPEKLNTSIPTFKKPNVELIQNQIAEMLLGLGFSEMMNNSLTTSDYVEKMGGEVLKAERNVELLNPLSQELNVMRQSMLFSALSVIEHNQNRQRPDLKLFEFGKTYHKYESYSENKRLILLSTGRKSMDSWNATPEKQNFYAMKGYVQALMQRLGLDGLMSHKALKNSLLSDGMQLFVLKQKIGEIGWISAKMKKNFGIKEEVFIADLDWDALMDSLKFAKVKYQELPKTFATRRDFSLLLNKQTTFAELEELATAADKKLLKSVGLFDVYEGKNLPEDKKSYAVSFTFQDDEKTLQDKQVDAIMEKIRASFEEKLGAELRK